SRAGQRCRFRRKIRRRETATRFEDDTPAATRKPFAFLRRGEMAWRRRPELLARLDRLPPRFPALARLLRHWPPFVPARVPTPPPTAGRRPASGLPAARRYSFPWPSGRVSQEWPRSWAP